MPIMDDENVENATISITDPKNNPEIIVTVNIVEDPKSDQGTDTCRLTDD